MAQINPDKLVKKQPLTDVAASTVTFFKEVINAGGELTDDPLGEKNKTA